MQAVRSVLHAQEERCIAQQYVRMVQVVDCREADNRAGHHIKSSLFYRLTDKEREWEIIQDLQTLKALGVKIESVTSDGARDIIKAVRYVCP